MASTGPSPDASHRLLPARQDHVDASLRGSHRPGLDLEPAQVVGLGALAHLVGDDRLQVERGDLLLLVRDRLEALERLVQRAALDLEAELLQGVLECMAAGVLAQDDRVRLEADLGRVHDLVGGALLEHAVLVDAGLVGERVPPNNSLVRRNGVAGQAGDQPAGARQLARVDVRVQAMRVAAGPKQHHDLLERAVAGALADAVDRALHLPGAGEDTREGVGDGQAEVIVAVD